jgi:hypothetical protein
MARTPTIRHSRVAGLTIVGCVLNTNMKNSKYHTSPNTSDSLFLSELPVVSLCPRKFFCLMCRCVIDWYVLTCWFISARLCRCVGVLMICVDVLMCRWLCWCCLLLVSICWCVVLTLVCR